MYGPLRCWVPAWTIRWCFLAAWTILRPSSTLRQMHFSTYTSLPAWQARIVARACHCSGVATTTPWTSLSSKTSRISFVTLGRTPWIFSRAAAAALPRASSRSQTYLTATFSRKQTLDHRAAAAAGAEQGQHDLFARRRGRAVRAVWMADAAAAASDALAPIFGRIPWRDLRHDISPSSKMGLSSLATQRPRRYKRGQAHAANGSGWNGTGWRCEQGKPTRLTVRDGMGPDGDTSAGASPRG